MGKSTVIQVLLLSRLTIEDLRVKGNKQRISLNSECLSLGSSKKIISALSDSDIVKFEFERIISDSKNTPLSFTFTANSNMPDNYITLTDYSDNEDINHKEFFYLMAERIGPRDYYTYSDYNTHIGYSGEYVAYVLDRIGKRKVDSKRCLDEKENTSFLRQQTEVWMDTIIPGIELNTDINEKSNTLSVEFRKRKLETSFLQPSNIGCGR